MSQPAVVYSFQASVIFLAFIASINCLAYFGQFRLFCCELKHFFAYVLKAQIVQCCSKANVRYAESKVELLQASNHLPERGQKTDVADYFLGEKHTNLWLGMLTG